MWANGSERAIPHPNSNRGDGTSTHVRILRQQSLVGQQHDVLQPSQCVASRSWWLTVLCSSRCRTISAPYAFIHQYHHIIPRRCMQWHRRVHDRTVAHVYRWVDAALSRAGSVHDDDHDVVHPMLHVCPKHIHCVCALSRVSEWFVWLPLCVRVHARQQVQMWSTTTTIPYHCHSSWHSRAMFEAVTWVRALRRNGAGGLSVDDANVGCCTMKGGVIVIITACYCNIR